IFRDRWDREEDSISKLNNEVGSLSTLLGKGKDILICGSTNVLSEDLLSLTGSSSKSCGKVVDCDSTPGDFTQDLMNKFTDTVVNLASDSDGEELAAPVVIVDDDSVQEVHSTITENDYAASDAKGTKFNKDMTEANARGIEGTHMGGMHKGAKSGVVNVADDCAESKKEFVTPNQISSIEAKESKSKKAVKRVSPGKVDDYEDDNAPIKLLKRAIKIEKIT
ncbi:replication factor-A carboxy-terminal domain protein, partial [Trifolium pratense]